MARVPGGFGVNDVMGVRRPDRSVRMQPGSFTQDPGMRAPDEFTDVTSAGYREQAKRVAERGGAKQYATSVEEEEADAEADELREHLLFVLAALVGGGGTAMGANRALGPGARPGLGLGSRNPTRAEWNAMKEQRELDALARRMADKGERLRAREEALKEWMASKRQRDLDTLVRRDAERGTTILGQQARNAPSRAEWNAMKEGRGIGREGSLAEGARNVDRSTLNRADYFGTPTLQEWLATKKNYFPDEKMYATMRAQRMNRFAPQRNTFAEGPLAGTQRHVPVHRPPLDRSLQPRRGSDPLSDWEILDTRSGLANDPGMTHLRHKLVELLMKMGKPGDRLLESRLGQGLVGYPSSVGSNIRPGLFSVPPGR